MQRFFQVALVFLLFVVVALAAALATMRVAIHGAEVTVPDFRGSAETEALRRAAALNLNLSTAGRFYSATVPAGRVLTQDPAPGTVVRRGWHVRVAESLGPQRAAIPETVGQQERMAAIELHRVGLGLGALARMPYAAQAAGTVISQTPAAGAANAEQPLVSLLLSAPVPTEATAYVMPDLRNQNVSAASAAIAHAGLKLAPPVYQDAGIAPVGAMAGNTSALAAPLPPAVRGTVLLQTPEPGMRVDATQPIVLTIAR